MKKPTRSNLKKAAIHVGRLVVVGLVFGYFFFHVALAYMYTRPARSTVGEITPANVGLEYEDVTFEGYDGARLKGWYIPSQNGAAVILLHGYRGNRVGLLMYAKLLAAHGYGMLLYDQRACGESEGEHTTWGWLDVYDVHGAVTYLQSLPDVQEGRIGSLGCSTGAEIALASAAREPGIRAVVADAPYFTNAQDLSAPVTFQDYANYPTTWMLIPLMQWMSGASPEQPLVQAVTEISPRPLLLISAGQDFEMRQAQMYYERAGEPKEHWNIPEAAHCAGPVVRAEEYEARIVAFFDEAFR